MGKFKKIESILYVEDEKNIQEELAEFLENFCEVLYIADDGEQGLALYKEHKPNIVVSDIRMPNMDGIEMSRKIKEISEQSSIIFTTAFSDVDYFQEAIELQVEGYILKPIDIESLEKKLISIITSYQLKKELEDKEQMLIQTSKLAAMGEMIGNIAHQWRQPLSVISTISSSYKVKKQMGIHIDLDDLIYDMDKISVNTKYLSQTIDDFRTYFIPNAENKVYSLKEYLNKCVDLVSASFDSHTIKLIKDIDDKINSIGDPNQLLQAIINVLNNAKDALNNVVNQEERLVFMFIVNHDNSNKDITIVVQDNAGGIDENIIDRIFEPYFTTKVKTKGTGLGLYITHTIITKHLKGDIKAENVTFEHDGKEYKGARFIITLPLVE